MRPTRTMILLIMGLALLVAAGWLGGLSGVGLMLTAVAAAGLGYAARHRADTSADPDSIGEGSGLTTMAADSHPPTVPAECGDLLALSQRVVEGAHAAPSLPQALYRVGQALSEALGSPSWICLRVEGWKIGRAHV